MKNNRDVIRRWRFFVLSFLILDLCFLAYFTYMYFDQVPNELYAVVGEVEHPMVEAHFIEWVFLQTDQGTQMKKFAPGSAPEVCFAILPDEKAEAVYAYCNLHGLWKKDL